MAFDSLLYCRNILSSSSLWKSWILWMNNSKLLIILCCVLYQWLDFKAKSIYAAVPLRHFLAVSADTAFCSSSASLSQQGSASCWGGSPVRTTRRYILERTGTMCRLRTETQTPRSSFLELLPDNILDHPRHFHTFEARCVCSTFTYLQRSFMRSMTRFSMRVSLLEASFQPLELGIARGWDRTWRETHQESHVQRHMVRDFWGSTCSNIRQQMPIIFEPLAFSVHDQSPIADCSVTNVGMSASESNYHLLWG